MNFREASTLVCTRGGETLTTMSTMSRALARRLAGENASFEDVEMITLAISRESDRRTLEAELQEIANTFGDGVAVDGARYVRHETGHVGYHSLCGTLHVARATYRQTGVRNGPTVVPLDLATGMIERGTPAMAKAVARNVSMSLRQFSFQFSEHLPTARGSYPRSPRAPWARRTAARAASLRSSRWAC